MPRAPRIAIVGGGIGGLAAALALEHRGAETIVCEQASNLSEIGAGLNLTPNAIKALRALGVEDAGQRDRVGDRLSQHPLVEEWPLHFAHAARRFKEKFGAPNLSRAPRRPAWRARRRAQDDRASAPACARLVEGRAKNAVARFADGSEIEADIVVGADGIHSVVRNSLFGADVPRFTGCICWRGMAAADAVPRDIDIADGAMWMGPHGHVVHYPGAPRRTPQHRRAFRQRRLDRGIVDARMRRVGGNRRPMRAGTSISPGSIRAASAGTNGRCTIAIRFCTGASAAPRCSAIPRTPCCPISARAPRWRSRTAVVLAAMIAKQPGDLDAALSAYESMRAPRAKAAVLGSRARAKENHLASRLAQLKRDVKFALRERFGGATTPRSRSVGCTTTTSARRWGDPSFRISAQRKVRNP